MTIRRQMIAWIAGPALLIYIFVLGIAAIGLHRQAKQEVERAMTRLATSYSARLDGYLREASRIAVTTAQFFGSGADFSDDVVYEMLSDDVRQSPLVYGACLAFEPGMRRPADELFAPYVCRDGNALRRMNIDQSVYDWYRDPEYTWYQQPKRLGHGVWSDPYFDEGAGGILMSTYSAPFDQGDSFGGVATVDIDLPRLRETVGREIDEQLDFVILASDGRYVFHPDASRIMSGTILDYVKQAGHDNLAPVVEAMMAGRPGAAWINGWESNEPLGLFYAPISSTGWTFVARVPASVVLAGVRRQTLLGGAALAATMLLICGAIYGVARRIAAPIVALEHGVMKVSDGDLDTQIDETAITTEVSNLAKSFNRMTADLRAHIDRLALEMAERRKIEHDLDVARQIQQSLLPVSKPNLDGYDISGWSRSANQTGGDYYDWQTLPDGRVLVSLADVSGHGLGPALVAAVCRAYARASVSSGADDLGAIVERLNMLLVDDMPEGRFVTFVGVLLDPRSHRAKMISAGHGPLFRCITASGELIESAADGLPFGLLPDSDYGPAIEFELETGDSILLVTDGLFEWTGETGEAYGLERLRESIRAHVHQTADEMIRGLYEQAQQFVGDVAQQDDVSIVVVRRM